MHFCIYTHTNISLYMYVCMYVYKYISLVARACTYTRTHHALIHTYMYRYMLYIDVNILLQVYYIYIYSIYIYVVIYIYHMWESLPSPKGFHEDHVQMFLVDGPFGSRSNKVFAIRGGLKTAHFFAVAPWQTW